MAKKRKSAKRPKDRSPGYPVIGLREAITKSRTLHEAEGMNYVAKLTAVNKLGYKSLHGKALQILSAIYQYGLIERRRGEIKLSEDAFAIICAPENSKEKQEAITRCANAPSIFNEIRDEYPSRLPSDESLKYWLQKKNFSSMAASKIIESLKETIVFAKLGEKEYNEGDEQQFIEDKNGMETSPMTIKRGKISDSGSKPQPWNIPLIDQTVSLAFSKYEPTKNDLNFLQSFIKMYADKKQDESKK